MMIFVAVGLVIQPGMTSTGKAAEPARIRVACIGDSITYGFGFTDRERDSYPSKLARLLGKEYDVRNFGVNGATLLKQGTRPYWTQDAYRDALAFRPDAVIIQLGTNDTNLQTWPEHGREFAGDYVALIDSFRKLRADARIFVCLPPPLFRDRGKEYDTDALLSREILLQIKDVARRCQAAVIDVNAAVADKSSMFPDGVHPNAAATDVIAGAVHQAIIQQVAHCSTSGK
ncbi:MAG: GDSL-type esterase/lipase family protein [Pirellulales bacterium]